MNRFNSSPYNFDPRARVLEAIRTPITITDVTLREGQQAAEVAFSPEEEVELAAALEAIGVPAVQAGYAGADDATIHRIRAACPKLRIAALLVGWQVDAPDAMRSARYAGADICSVLFRAADSHLANLGVSRDQSIARTQELVSLAVELGFPTVIFGPSFSTLADFDHLICLYQAALEAGAGVIALADSMGTAKPGAVRFLVESMRALAGDRGVRVHMHNDYGLAVANTLAGVEAGADWIEATVNGLGERAGNCPLEEIVVALEALYGIEVGVRTDGLFELCKLVERLTGAPIPAMKPVAGENTFANKLEIHVRAAASDRSLMEPYDPVLVGNRRTIKLGRGTGPTGIRLKAAELGLELEDSQIEVLVEKVNRWAIETKRAVSDHEFAEMAAT